MPEVYAIIMLRGTVGIPYDVKHTLRLLRLIRKFNCSLYPATPAVQGMLNVVKDWVTWGEIDYPTLVELLRKRGRTTGNKPLTEEVIKSKLGVLNISNIEDLAKSILEGKILFHKLEDYGIKPVFRLHPPKKGFKGSIKKPYKDGGELGYRGHAINELLKRMM
uniref:Large ribosomal subunit protein uL30 n=1 Tax=Ignisphaera aggregans TaxID=334771 RepID=A0A7C2VG96_9CREN